MTAVTLGTRDFRQAAWSVLEHASSDEELPDIHRVRLIPDANNLTVVATDRYTIGAAIVSIIEHDEPELDIIDLLVDDLRKILTLFPAGKEKADEPEYLLRIETEKNHVVITDVSGLGFGGRSLKVPRIALASDYPKVLELIGRAHRAEPATIGGLLVGGGLLRRFTVAAKVYGAPLLIDSKDGFKALLVRCGESFIGILMPANTDPDTEADLADWAVGWDNRLPHGPQIGVADLHPKRDNDPMPVGDDSDPEIPGDDES